MWNSQLHTPSRQTSGMNMSSKHTSRRTLCCAAGFFIALSCCAQAFANSTDRKKAINVKADSSEYNERAGTQSLSGDVEISQGSMSIRADNIKIELKEGTLFRISGIGSPIRFQQLTETNELMRGQSNEITYNIETSTITFRGNAEFERPGQKFSGHSIEYNMKELTFKAAGKKTTDGSSSGRVNIVLQPGKINQ